MGKVETVYSLGKRVSDLERKFCNCREFVVGTGVPTEEPASTISSFYVDDATGLIYYWDGSSWNQIGGVASEVNDLSTAVTWANIPDANVPESSVTQHRAAIFTENQFSYKVLAEGATASLNLVVAREVLAVGSGTTATTTIVIPTGARLEAVQCNVDVAVTTSGANNTFDVAFSGGSTTSVETGVAGTLNTKVDQMLVPEKTTGATEITLTAGNAENFSTGSVEILVYYYALTSMADA